MTARIIIFILSIIIIVYPDCSLKVCEHYAYDTNKCACHGGYKLLSDGRSCQGTISVEHNMKLLLSLL